MKEDKSYLSSWLDPHRWCSELYCGQHVTEVVLSSENTDGNSANDHHWSYTMCTI